MANESRFLGEILKNLFTSPIKVTFDPLEISISENNKIFLLLRYYSEFESYEISFTNNYNEKEHKQYLVLILNTMRKKKYYL